ncbi:transposable element tcb1 transposase [Plakobranchus ocellatus]|uniref:Transposable element tcb1 transposase n=1 Tax=Plakobranchus ocellatus TaxID=259542 RepID=A0AAV3YMC0_9GAST|nr:transposable element tcb1 transposase [Plakobranchus ocellatus]
MSPWPANSPDLNPFEHLWNIMDRALRHQEQQPTNPQELVMELIGIWERFCKETFVIWYSSCEVGALQSPTVVVATLDINLVTLSFKELT